MKAKPGTHHLVSPPYPTDMETGCFFPQEVWDSVIQFVYEINHRERMDTVLTELLLLVTWERKAPVFPLMWRRGRVCASRA